MPASIATACSSKKVPQSGHHLPSQFGVLIGEIAISDCFFVHFNNGNFFFSQRIPINLSIPYFFSFQELFPSFPLLFGQLWQLLDEQTRLLFFFRYSSWWIAHLVGPGTWGNWRGVSLHNEKTTDGGVFVETHCRSQRRKRHPKSGDVSQ